MNRILTLLSKHKVHLPLIAFVLAALMFAASCYERYANGDEAVIAEHASSLAKHGYIHENLRDFYTTQNIPNERLLVYHKLFALSGALSMKVFGFSIWSFRAVTLLFMVLFLLFMFLYLKLERPQSRNVFFLIAAMLLVNTNFFDHACMFRPEIMSMCLGFISFFCVTYMSTPPPQNTTLISAQ